MECHNCGDDYKRIAAHWSKSNCQHPSFTDRQKEIITGILMGDGTIDDKYDDKRNPRFKLQITNLEYAEYVYRKFKELSTGEPYVHRTAEELANTYSQFSNSEDPKDYSTQYKIQTISHPELSEFENWYSSGDKVFPESINLTPTILKHWYVCDGSYNNNGHRDYLSIHLSNERNNKEKIEGYFDKIGHPISRWRDDEQDYGGYKTTIIFNKTETKDLLDYMGEPLPGFEYKWS